MAALDRILSFLASGGPVLIILSVMSVVMAALILVKAYQFYRLGIFQAHGLERLVTRWMETRDKDVPGRLDNIHHPASAILAVCIRELSGSSRRSIDQIREEVSRIALHQIAVLSRYLRGLEVIAQTAPLLGLLGTIFGMITAFQVLEQAGSRADPALLAGGIWEALLTTAAGLSVAIPAAVAHHWLQSTVERTTRDIEDLVTRVMTAPAPTDHSKDETRAA